MIHPCHIPRQPSEEQFEFLESLRVDIDAGRVWRADGFEYCCICTFQGRVSIPWYNDGKYATFRRYHIVWWRAKGYWPRMTIDHKDRIRHHDWIENLKEATMSEQAQNRNPQPKYKPNQIKDLEAFRTTI